MWSQSWGQMIWGGATSVPAAGAWGAALLAALLAIVGARLVSRRGRARVAGVAVLALALLAPFSARALTLPFTFTNGTVADANQVNANFEAARAAVDALQSPERFITTQAADLGLVGTTINNTFITTSPAASVNPTLAGGTYQVSWYAEVMRTNSGGGQRIMFRVRDLSDGRVLSVSRLLPGENGSDTAMPADTDTVAAGEVIVLSGSQRFTVAAGTAKNIRLEYAANNTPIPITVLRVRRQEISLIRVAQ